MNNDSEIELRKTEMTYFFFLEAAFFFIAFFFAAI